MTAPSMGTLAQIGVTALELARRAEIVPVPLLEQSGELLGRILAGEFPDARQAEILHQLFELQADFSELVGATPPAEGPLGNAPLPMPVPLPAPLLNLIGQHSLALLARARFYDPSDVASTAETMARAIMGQTPAPQAQTAMKGALSMAQAAADAFGIPPLPMTAPSDVAPARILLEDFGRDGLYPVGWLTQFVGPFSFKTTGHRKTGGACCAGCEDGGSCDGELCGTEAACGECGGASHTRLAPEGWECRRPDERRACFSQLFGPLR